jgi:peptide/nickel transport system permease protein
LQRYILGRIVQGIVSLLVLSFIVFLLARMSGDPVSVFLPEDATEKDRAVLMHHMGLDRPLLVQYLIFLSQGIRGDFGRSLRTNRPCLEMVLERLPATLLLGAFSVSISLIIALPIGVYAAVKRGRLFDVIARGFAILGQSLPLFWLGVVLIFIFAVRFPILPTGGFEGAKHLILPGITVGWYVVAGIMRVTRSSMLDILDSEYIKMARAKGLAEWVVIWKHGFKNAALPVVTFSALLFVMMLGGSIVTEMVFAWPGVGRLAIQAITWRDFPIVQTVVVLLGAMYIGANLLVDIAYAYLNPKIRYQK